MKRNIIAPKRGKHKIFRAAASLTAAAAMLFFHVASAWAADDFITLRDAGRVDEGQRLVSSTEFIDMPKTIPEISLEGANLSEASIKKATE